MKSVSCQEQVISGLAQSALHHTNNKAVQNILPVSTSASNPLKTKLAILFKQVLISFLEQISRAEVKVTKW